MFDTKQKYVKVGRYDDEFIIFPITIDHDTFKNLNPKSAGFCYVNEDKVTCFGRSVTLDMESHPDDSKLATKQICGWEAMIKLEKTTKKK